MPDTSRPNDHLLSGKVLSGKVAVVTGATKGIGKAVAETLAREGASVAICGRSQAEVEACKRADDEHRVTCVGNRRRCAAA